MSPISTFYDADIRRKFHVTKICNGMGSLYPMIPFVWLCQDFLVDGLANHVQSYAQFIVNSISGPQDWAKDTDIPLGLTRAMICSHVISVQRELKWWALIWFCWQGDIETPFIILPVSIRHSQCSFFFLLSPLYLLYRYFPWTLMAVDFGAGYSYRVHQTNSETTFYDLV